MRSITLVFASGLFIIAGLWSATAHAECPANTPCRDRLADPPVRKPAVQAEPEGPTVDELRVEAARAIAAAEQELLARQIALSAATNGTYPTAEAKAQAEGEAKRAYVLAKTAKDAAYDAYFALTRPMPEPVPAEAPAEPPPTEESEPSPWHQIDPVDWPIPREERPSPP